MNYEKKYNEALERAKNLRKDAIDMGENIRAKQCEIIFPELNESDDEKIRKALLNEFIHLQSKGYKFAGLEGEDIIAWLEKQRTSEKALQYLKENHSPSEISDFQAAMNIAVAKAYDKGMKDGLKKHGEQRPIIEMKSPEESLGISSKEYNEIVNDCIYGESKSTEQIAPKFKVGEWLCENKPNNYARFIQILKTVKVYGKERYRISRDIHNDEDIVECRFVEDNWHSFNIQDAKPGDVLVDVYGNIGIFDKCDDFDWISCCSLGNNGGFQYFTVEHENEKTYPATKEERELLFQKNERSWLGMEY